MSRAALLMVLALLLLAGCAAPGQRGPEEESLLRAGGVPGDGRIELSEPEPMPVYGNPNRPIPPPPPPAWLVAGDEVVQASYGLSCEAGACNGKEPQRQASELATAELPADEKVLVVVGSDRSIELAAGVVGWKEAPDGPTPPSVFTESGIPYFLRALDARAVPEGERPTVKLASGGGDLAAGYTVFELASTGNPGDRLLSAFTYTGESLGREDRTAYHWRLNPGEEGENLPPPEKGLPKVVELERGPETVELSPEEVAEQTSLREVEEASFDRPGRTEVTEEGYLWVLEPKERPQGPGGGPKEGKALTKAGPPPATTLLKLDPDTREVLSTIEEPGFGYTLAVGAGAVWLAGNPEGGPEGDGTVARLDPETEAIRTIEVGGRANQIAAAEGGVWIAVGASPLNPRVVRLDPETGEVIAEIELLGIATSIAVDDDTGDIWAGSLGRLPFEPGEIVRIDPATNEISQRFEIEGGAARVVAASGGTVRVVGQDGRFFEIDPRSEVIERTFIGQHTPG